MARRRNSTGYVRAKIRANSARRNGDSSQGPTKKEIIDSLVAYTTQAWEYEGESFHPADEAKMRRELNKLTKKDVIEIMKERDEEDDGLWY